MHTTIEMRTDSCPVCFIVHAFPMSMYHEAQKTKPNHTIYCPNGHKWHYLGESDADRERRLKERAQQENARLAEEAAQERRRRLATERTLANHKKRAINGTCPCCKRTFSNMARHMKTKHPDYNVVPLAAKA